MEADYRSKFFSCLQSLLSSTFSAIGLRGCDQMGPLGQLRGGLGMPAICAVCMDERPKAAPRLNHHLHGGRPRAAPKAG